MISKILLEMEIISLSLHNIIKRRLFYDDIEVVATGPHAEEPNVLVVFKKRPKRITK